MWPPQLSAPPKISHIRSSSPSLESKEALQSQVLVNKNWKESDSSTGHRGTVDITQSPTSAAVDQGTKTKAWSGYHIHAWCCRNKIVKQLGGCTGPGEIRATLANNGSMLSSSGMDPQARADRCRLANLDSPRPRGARLPGSSRAHPRRLAIPCPSTRRSAPFSRWSRPRNRGKPTRCCPVQCVSVPVSSLDIDLFEAPSRAPTGQMHVENAVLGLSSKAPTRS